MDAPGDDLAHANLRTWKISDEGHGYTGGRGGGFHLFGQAVVVPELAVGEIETKRPDALLDQTLEHGPVVASRSNGGDDLGQAEVPRVFLFSAHDHG